MPEIEEREMELALSGWIGSRNHLDLDLIKPLTLIVVKWTWI